MQQREFILVLAAGLSATWIFAKGQPVPGNPAGSTVTPPQVNPTGTPPPATGTTLSPVADFAPQISSPAEASEGETPSPPPEGPTAGPIPQTDEAATSPISAPDGIVPLVVSPLAMPQDPLAAEAATPFTANTAEPALASEEDALEEPDSETPPPADDRSAPWVAAPGGFSAPGVGANAGGLGFAPSGFTSVNPGFPMGGVAVGEGVFDGLSIAATFSGTYTSNATSSPGEPFAPIQDDFILGLGGSISYLSKASEWTFGGTYGGTYNQYLELTEYSGYDQNLSLVGNYDGTKLSATATGSVAYTQGNNRYYSSEFVQQTSYNFGLNLRYRLSTKTSLQGNIGQSFSTTSENSFNDTESFNMGLAALWKYSKLTEFGPGVRYSFLSGGNRDSRSSIGPELLVNYKLATKVSLNSRVGIEFSEYENGGTADPALTGSIGLVYNASRLWSMNLSLYKGAQADTSSADVFTDVTSIRLGLNRKIHRATLNLGLSYEINAYQTSGTSTVSNREDRDYFNINTSIGMPVFANTCFASIFVQYNDQTGSVTDTYDAVQSGFSISRRF